MSLLPADLTTSELDVLRAVLQAMRKARGKAGGWWGAHGEEDWVKLHTGEAGKTLDRALFEEINIQGIEE